MQIGPYLVLNEIARGGQGLVYRAQAPNGELVALKLLLTQRQLSPKARKRFLIEVGALSRMQHPHVVPVVQVGEHQGAPWLALKFIEGDSLEERLRKGPMELDEAILIARQLAQALAHVHASGVLHRDLKPANVLLGEGPGGVHAMLTDFGLARDEQAAPLFSRLTVAGAMAGTPGYWAPEQAQGEIHAFGPWTDLYGLGATLFACITGEPPVDGTDMNAIVAAASGAPVSSLHAFRGDVPEWLDELCRACLAHRPEDRPASAVAVIEALDLGQARAPRGGSRFGLVGVLAGLGLIAGGVGVALALQTGQPAVDTPAVTPPPTTPPVDEAAERRAQAIELCAQGRAARMNSRFEEALVLLERAAELDPSAPRVFTERGGCKAGLGRLEEALADFDLALEHDVKDALALCLRGMLRMEQGDHQAALADLQRSVELDPSRVTAQGALGACQAQLGWQEDAVESYARALELDPSRADIWTSRGMALFDLQRYADAIVDFDRALALDGNRLLALRNRAHAHRKLGNVEQAHPDFDRAVSLAPRDGQLRYWRGRMAAALGRRQEAIADYSRGIELDPAVPFGYAHRGAQLLLLRRFEAALDDFDRAVELLPNYSFALLNRGWALSELERHEEAIASYDTAIEIQATAQGYARRAWSHAELGQLEQARADSDRALELDRRAVLAWVSRARCSLARGAHAEAHRDLEQMLRIDAEHPHPYVFRAAVFLAEGEPRKALADLDRLEGLPHPPNKTLRREVERVRAAALTQLAE